MNDELLTNENINFEDLKELEDSDNEPFNMATPAINNRKSQLTMIPEREETSETQSKQLKGLHFLREPDQDDALMMQQPSNINSMVLDESSIHDQTIHILKKNSDPDPQDFQLFSITEMISGQPSGRSTVGANIDVKVDLVAAEENKATPTPTKFEEKKVPPTTPTKTPKKESPKYNLKSKNLKLYSDCKPEPAEAAEAVDDTNDDLLHELLGLNNNPMSSNEPPKHGMSLLVPDKHQSPILPTLNIKLDEVIKPVAPTKSQTRRKSGGHQRVFSAMEKPRLVSTNSKKELGKKAWNYIEQLQKYKKQKSEIKTDKSEVKNNVSETTTKKERKKEKSPNNSVNFSAPASFTNFSCVNQDYHKQQQSRLISDWKELCKIIDGIPNGQNLKTRHHFSRTDLISVTQQFKKKMQEYEQIVQFEQQKSKLTTDENTDILEKLKNSKLENKIYQQKLEKIAELDYRVENLESQLLKSNEQLRKAMIQNVITLEFNKDISDIISKNSSSDSVVIKQIQKIQNELQMNSVDFDSIAHIIDENTEMLKLGVSQPQKVVKIDLDQMTSGSEESSSSSDQSSSNSDIGQETTHNFSQADSEINMIQINPETQTVKTSKSPFIKNYPKKPIIITKSTTSVTTKNLPPKPKKKETPSAIFEKLRNQYKEKQLQYSVLLEKYEKQTKRILEYQDVIKENKYEDMNQQKTKFKLSIQLLESEITQKNEKIDTLKSLLRDQSLDLNNHESKVQNLKITLQQTTEKMNLITQTMQSNQKMQELQNTVVKLCDQHLFQQNSEMSAQDKKLLQTIFGESVLISNQFRDKMLEYKDLIIFLLNEVVLKLFEFENKKGANRSNSIQQPALSFANQLKKVQIQEEHDFVLDKEIDMMEFSLMESSRMQESVVSTTTRMRSLGRKNQVQVTDLLNSIKSQILDKFEKHNQFAEFINDISKAKFMKHLDKQDMISLTNFNRKIVQKVAKSPTLPSPRPTRNIAIDKSRYLSSSKKSMGSSASSKNVQEPMVISLKLDANKKQQSFQTNN